MQHERPRDRVKRAIKSEAAFAHVVTFLLPTAVACILIWISFR